MYSCISLKHVRRHQPLSARSAERFDDRQCKRYGVEPDRRKRTTFVHNHERSTQTATSKIVMLKPKMISATTTAIFQNTNINNKPENARPKTGSVGRHSRIQRRRQLHNADKRKHPGRDIAPTHSVQGNSRGRSRLLPAQLDAHRGVLHAVLSVVGSLAVLQLASLEEQAENSQFDTSHLVLGHLATAVAEPTVVECIRILCMGFIVHRFSNILTVPSFTTHRKHC